MTNNLLKHVFVFDLHKLFTQHHSQLRNWERIEQESDLHLHKNQKKNENLRQCQRDTANKRECVFITNCKLLKKRGGGGLELNLKREKTWNEEC